MGSAEPARRSGRLIREIPLTGLPATGPSSFLSSLFTTSACNARNRIFKTAAFDDDLFFVFLNQSLDRLQSNTGGRLPSDPIFVENCDDYHRILWDLSFLALMFKNMRSHPSSGVRAKHLATYDLYRQRYPDLLAAFEESGFQPECICPSVDWSSRKKVFDDDVYALGA